MRINTRVQLTAGFILSSIFLQRIHIKSKLYMALQVQNVYETWRKKIAKIHLKIFIKVILMKTEDERGNAHQLFQALQLMTSQNTILFHFHLHSQTTFIFHVPHHINLSAFLHQVLRTFSKHDTKGNLIRAWNFSSLPRFHTDCEITG